jgi:hypothetical protein
MSLSDILGNSSQSHPMAGMMMMPSADQGTAGTVAGKQGVGSGSGGASQSSSIGGGESLATQGRF